MAPWVTTDLRSDAAAQVIHRVEADSRQLALVCLDGVWHAFDDVCPHAGCPFSEDGELDGATLICNCHGSEFDLVTGVVLQGPADDPLRLRAVRVNAGTLEVASDAGSGR